jgi:hypothetical protein
MALDVGQLNVMTREQYWPDVVSQVTTSTPFITRLFKRKKMRGSGRSFKWTLLTEKHEGQWYSGYEILGIAPTDPFKEAELDWVDHNLPIALSGDELDKNTGEEAFHDLMAEQMKYCRDSADFAIGKGIMQGRGNDFKEPAGLYNRDTAANSALEPTATGSAFSGTYAGIVRGTDDPGSGDFTNWWQNVGRNEAGLALTLVDMQSNIADCEERGQRPSIIVTSYKGSTAFYNIAQGYQRIPHDEITEIGFSSFQFAGVPIVADKHAYRDSTNNRSYYWYLYEKDLELRFLNGKFMKRTPWFTPKDQDAKVMHMRNKFMFGVRTPRIHCLHFAVAE